MRELSQPSLLFPPRLTSTRVISCSFAKIENHFFINAGWMRDGQLLEKEGIDKIRHIPTVIAQGR